MRTFLVLLLTLTAVIHAERVNLAEDDASHSAYGSVWETGKNGGSGFGAWTLLTDAAGDNRFAGFFLANPETNRDVTGILKENKAFGLFANGDGFEQAIAFRPFAQPLAPGESFSFLMETGAFEKKSEKDTSEGGSAGLVLRSGQANAAVSDYNAGARFEFGHYQGQPNYQVHDGDTNHDSGVPVSDDGVIVTVTLTGTDTYDLEIQTVRDKKLTKLNGRRLAGTGNIESMALFNRNSEKNDVYFNGFQISRETQENIVPICPPVGRDSVEPGCRLTTEITEGTETG